jgi:hypothetical protein
MHAQLFFWVFFDPRGETASKSSRAAADRDGTTQLNPGSAA